MNRPAILMLADGTAFRGHAVGVDGLAVGEVVFNTAMSGYQEILSDPSYCEQLVTLTYPHIGNVGCNDEDMESGAVQAAGLVVRDVPRRHSNWRASESLPAFLQRHGVVAISDVDTRALTRHLRSHGSQGGAIMAGAEINEALALDAAREFPGLSGYDLAQRVSCTDTHQWDQGCWQPTEVEGGPEVSLESAAALLAGREWADGRGLHVVVMDFGVKHNILRCLSSRHCKVTIVPARTSASAILALEPNGVLLSNGPGDPEPCDYAIEAIRELLAARVPLFGICLGHQLLALACGANTLKMKFGHHGANHPVQDLNTGRVMISSQNHGFAADADTLGNSIVGNAQSLFDGTLQGIARQDVPAFGFQGHPEASPGPHDVEGLFDDFIRLMQGQ